MEGQIEWGYSEHSLSQLFETPERRPERQNRPPNPDPCIHAQAHMLFSPFSMSDHQHLPSALLFQKIFLTTIFIFLFYLCVRSQYFGSLMVIFCVELASGVWTYDEVRCAMNKQECLLSPLSHVNNMAATWPFPGVTE